VLCCCDVAERKPELGVLVPYKQVVIEERNQQGVMFLKRVDSNCKVVTHSTK
jgi:hypothetical protein